MAGGFQIDRDDCKPSPGATVFCEPNLTQVEWVCRLSSVAGHYAGRCVATPKAVAAGPDRGTAVAAAVVG